MINAVAAAAAQIYHSEDNIAELRICVRLRPRREAGGGAAAAQGLSAAAAASVPLLHSQGVAVAGESMHEVFRWKERVLGRHEQPGDEEGPNRQGQYLFSRLLAAGSPMPEAGNLADDESSEEATASARNCCRRRRSEGHTGPSLASPEFAASVLPAERMQLLAVFDAPRDPEAEAEASEARQCEVLLCELRAHGSGHVLEVRPPFHSPVDAESSLPFRFKLPGGAEYEYTVENASHVPTDAERQQALEAQHNFDTSVPQMRQNLAGSGFDSLSGMAEQYAVTGEIVSYELDPPETLPPRSVGAYDDLEGDAMFRCTVPVNILSVIWRAYYLVVCELSLPVGGEWQAIQTQGAEGLSSNVPICTQCASMSGCFTTRRQFVFNHPLELHLAHQTPDVVLEGPRPDGLPPRLVFQVLSVDSWQRFALQGYTFVDIPRTPGQHDIQVKLWSPVGTITEQMSANVLGAFVPLASPHLVAVADMHQRDRLPRNRSALRARTVAGALHVRLNVVCHRPDATQIRVSKERNRQPRSLSAGLSLERTTGLRRRRRRGQSAETGARATAPSLLS